jgi:hypothetical protein
MVNQDESDWIKKLTSRIEKATDTIRSMRAHRLSDEYPVGHPERNDRVPKWARERVFAESLVREGRTAGLPGPERESSRKAPQG